MRRGSAAVALVVILAGCGIQDPYPLPDEPPDTAVFHPVSIGQTITEAVLFIEARRGEFLEIVSVEPIGQLDGATVEMFVSELAVDEGGNATLSDERVPAEGVRVERMVDASDEAPANTVAIVADVTATESGRYVITGLNVTFRINGAPERDGEGSDVVVTMCADDPAPTDCE
jgi:hypothetical protein